MSSGRGVHLGPVDPLVVGGVLDTTDDPDFQFQDDVEGGASIEQLGGEGEVLVHGEIGGVEHVALEHGGQTLVDPLTADLEEGADEPVDPIRGAMVGVQGDVHRVAGGDHTGELGQGLGTQSHVLVRLPGGELTAAVGDLDYPVGLRLREALERSEDGR
jgi:hypothetical protein